MNLKIGIIGGSGMNNTDIIKESKSIKVTTQFGDPSDVLIEGLISGIPCVLLARHGWNHTIMPTNVNYRANMLALKNVGCTHVIASTACGSLNDNMMPGHIVVLDQFIDRTTKRSVTFYDGSSSSFSGILHLPMDLPFCSRMRTILYQTCLSFNLPVHANGTMITIDGPRFSTKAESKMFRQWGGDVINMTTVPEVILARELGLCYATMALVTDFDCWKENKEPVRVELVMKQMKSNADNAIKVIQKAIETIAEQKWEDTLLELKNSNARRPRQWFESGEKREKKLDSKGNKTQMIERKPKYETLREISGTHCLEKPTTTAWNIEKRFPTAGFTNGTLVLAAVFTPIPPVIWNFI